MPTITTIANDAETTITITAATLISRKISLDMQEICVESVTQLDRPSFIQFVGAPMTAMMRADVES
ncbi:unnamed protein product [Ceratitis capitata]|uniref:(Mediterranean fruit fly) hypothetical protein n=1 Tax=Ceratitis capitata TaxID=7213 RepID=A0A811TYW9_CERCA|nr:unnamed protein product [Ceratitis capitata]